MYIDTMSMSGHTYGRPDRCLLGVSLTETLKQYNTAAEVYIKSSMDQYLDKLKMNKSWKVTQWVIICKMWTYFLNFKTGGG